MATQKLWHIKYVAGNPAIFSAVITAAGGPYKRSEALDGAANIAPSWRCWVEHGTSGERIYESEPEKTHRQRLALLTTPAMLDES